MPLAWSSFATPVALDETTYGYRWNKEMVTKVGKKKPGGRQRGDVLLVSFCRPTRHAERRVHGQANEFHPTAQLGWPFASCSTLEAHWPGIRPSNFSSNEQPMRHLPSSAGSR